MGISTPTTAFDGAIWYFSYTMKTHWTYAWRSLVQKNNFWQNYSCENLDNFSLLGLLYMHNFSLLGLLYMHRWCLHGPINSYYSFGWNNLILCLYNVDTLNICMEELGSEKNIFWQNYSCENLDNFSLIRLLNMHRWCLHGLINSYHSF